MKKLFFAVAVTLAALNAAPSPARAAHVIQAGTNPPVKVLIYGDYQCPFTAKTVAVIDQIRAEFPDRVAILFAHFPLSFHDQAVKASVAAACADQQGLFWAYSKALFHNQTQLADDYYLSLADALQIKDRNSFEACLKDPSVKSQVELETLVGEASGVGGTPTAFINGEVVRGAYPYSHYKEIIERLLAAGTPTPRDE